MPFEIGRGHVFCDVLKREQDVRRRRRVYPTLAFLTLAAACGGTTVRPPKGSPGGPPRLRAAVVERHAAQFDDELAERPAGSQQEQAASFYILGHLQKAGYALELDPVPVRDLLESTNLMAAPPGGNDPSTVVAVPYDTAPGSGSNGEAIATFLELARALKVARPEHDVQLVALGAEHSDVGPGHLGSRRLAQVLLDKELDPRVVSIGVVARGRTFVAAGEQARELKTLARRAGIDIRPEGGPTEAGGVDVFSRAGFDAVTVGGDPLEVGRVLLDYLTSAPASPGAG